MRKSIYAVLSWALGKLKIWLSALIYPPRRVLSLLRPLESKLPLIRIGGRNDGGYLLPDDLEGIEGVFSPGVDVTATFEKHFTQLGIPCWLLDGSVDQPPEKNELIHFQKKWLGEQTSANTTTLEEWVNQHLPSSNELVLQMDIETAEWEILRTVDTNTLKKFRIIVIELHALSNKLLKPHKAKYLYSIFRKLSKNHSVVHFHPNNCCGADDVNGLMVPRIAEITLIRRDRNIAGKRFSVLPHPLDAPNTENPRLRSPWE
jgi:hypothetical protein